MQNAGSLPNRLGRNRGGYSGERVDIDSILEATLDAAEQSGWERQSIPCFGNRELPVLVRRPPGATRHVYISAGIHGDEPAGPLALADLIRDARWPDTLSAWVCPCLNPGGFAVNRRENDHGIDLNRDYKAARSAEVQAHIRWLRTQPQFDLALCLHEDWESNGFYLYELNPDRVSSHADAILRSVSEVCPIDLSPTIEGRAAENGVIQGPIDLEIWPDWPEPFFLINEKTRHSYTLETPSDFELPVRVKAMRNAVHTLLNRMAGGA